MLRVDQHLVYNFQVFLLSSHILFLPVGGDFTLANFNAGRDGVG